MERRVDTSLLVYPILMVLVYVLFRYPLINPYVGDFIASVEVLLMFLLISRLSLMAPVYRNVIPTLIKGIGFALAFYLLPSEPYTTIAFQLPLAILTLGITVASLAPNLPEVPALVIRGIGVALILYGLHLFSDELARGDLVAPAFLYAAVAAVIVYAGASLERFGLIGSRFIEKNISAVILLFGLLGLYKGLRPYIIEKYPGYAFYLEWGVIGLTIIMAAIAVQNHLTVSNIENYIVSEWRKHSMELSIVEDEEFKLIKRAIEDFVLRKKKAPLVVFLTYYGIKAFSNIEKVQEITEPIVEYQEEGYSFFTPEWLVRKKERKNLQRRIRLVKSAIEEIEKSLGGKK